MTVPFAPSPTESTLGAAGLIPAQAGPSEPVTPTLRPLSLGSVAGLPQVNLLPPEISQTKRLRKIKLGLAAGVTASAVLVTLAALSAGGAVQEAQDQLVLEQSRGRALDRAVLDFGDVSATYARVRTDQLMLAEAMGREVRWSRYLNDLSLTIPDGVWVTQMTVVQDPATAAAPGGAAAAAAAPAAPAGIPVAGTTGPSPAGGRVGTVTVAGMATDHDAVATWLEVLAGEKGYTDPYFSVAEESLVGSKKFIRFSSTVTVDEAALSGCYTLERTGC